MPDNSNKLSQFWQELKRRKVIKVIALIVLACDYYPSRDVFIGQ